VTDRIVQGRQREAKSRDLHIQADLAPALVCGDQRLVEQLVANLVDNAIRHNLINGRVNIITRTSAGRALLSVANTGPVVPKASMDRLFQPFQRHPRDRTGRGRGLGLGLSIVQAIADAHGATIIAHPRPGGGLEIEASFHQQPPGLARTPSMDQGRSTPQPQDQKSSTAS
jgi:signal transduction histidine kinase